MRAALLITALLLLCAPTAHPATIVNSAGIEICILPTGSAFVEWNATASVFGDNPESVQSLSVTGELRSYSNPLCTQGGVSLGTCSREVQQPGSSVIICGGSLATSCGVNYFRSSSVSFSTPPKPSNGKQWSGCTFGDCAADQCFLSEELTTLEKISGLPICI